MSGFEVVGVVLGALPLIVTALEHYSEGINTIMKLRRYKSEVDGIGRQLRQQQAIFINCCERLLDGVVTAEQAETLIRRPGEGSWSSKETKRLIKVRLGSDLEDFLSTIEDTRKKLITIQRKLDLGPNGELVAEDDDEQLASQFNFRVALSSERSDAGLGPTTTGWKEMILRVYEQETYLTEPEQPSRRPTLAKPRKSVRFSIVAKSQDQPHMVAHTEDLSSASFGLRGAVASVALDNAIAMGLPSLISRFSSGLPQVVDICRTLADAQSQPTVECYGYLTDTLVQSRRFDVLFVRQNDRTVYDRPYLAKRLPEDTVNTSTQVTAAGHTPTVQNPTVFYLGILLIELLLGDTLDNIRTANNWKVDPNVPELERDFDTAQKLLPRVMEKGEANYHTAVKRCVNCMFESENAGDLEDAAFRQEVYEKVVGPLEEGLQLTQM
ncbi:Uu.00g064170.m01.CDS01 [Anthostomella pinea]|uniref:Uu.00g064170.m01.CDS01 n=1 Tax=Anthostomella pinea TaxID=933095 RepID=A0AAI8VTH2_9PEZI|nr:Uu.00g064170.m01.CDS01 [Anthostomella pinea]